MDSGHTKSGERRPSLSIIPDHAKPEDDCQKAAPEAQPPQARIRSPSHTNSMTAALCSDTATAQTHPADCGERKRDTGEEEVGEMEGTGGKEKMGWCMKNLGVPYRQLRCAPK